MKSDLVCTHVFSYIVKKSAIFHSLKSTQGACHWVFSAWIFQTGCMSLGVFCLDFSHRVHVIGCFLLGFVFLAPYLLISSEASSFVLTLYIHRNRMV